MGALIANNQPWGWGGLGMELGIDPCLLQSHRLGKMGKSLSSAESTVQGEASHSLENAAKRAYRTERIRQLEAIPAIGTTSVPRL